jgi:hypothetical protein
MSAALSKPTRISPNEFERDTAQLNKKILQQKDSLQPEMKVEPSSTHKNKSKKSSLPWILVLSVIGFFSSKRLLNRGEIA